MLGTWLGPAVPPARASPTPNSAPPLYGTSTPDAYAWKPRPYTCQRQRPIAARSRSSHMLEEGAPCRDLLLCANLAGCAMGSLVLAVEAPAGGAATTGTTMTATGGGALALAPGGMATGPGGNTGAGGLPASLLAAGASTAATVGGGGGAAAGNSTSGLVGLGLANASTHRGSFTNLLSTAGSIPAPVLLTAPLSVLHSSRQVGARCLAVTTDACGGVGRACALLRQLQAHSSTPVSHYGTHR